MISYIDLYNFDPLSDVTRKERKTLIIVTLIALAFSNLGLYPTKISALGIDFSSGGIELNILLPLCFRLILVYLLITFILYAFSDFVRSWIVRYQTNFDAAISSLKEPLKLTEEQDRRLQNQGMLHPPFRKTRKPIFVIRGIIDFLFPVFFALWALFSI